MSQPWKTCFMQINKYISDHLWQWPDRSYRKHVELVARKWQAFDWGLQNRNKGTGANGGVVLQEHFFHVKDEAKKQAIRYAWVEKRQVFSERAGAYWGESIMTHALGCLSLCVCMTRFVLLETSKSLNQRMWYKVTCHLIKNSTLIDSLWSWIWGEFLWH